ncbi:MAG: hypothetical protein NTW06_04840 [Candidatus Falkowbacteria bacterium]|nr:hypothetical protein [Candidatus Falkowbacteria bacterium]
MDNKILSYNGGHLDQVVIKALESGWIGMEEYTRIYDHCLRCYHCNKLFNEILLSITSIDLYPVCNLNIALFAPIKPTCPSYEFFKISDEDLGVDKIESFKPILNYLSYHSCFCPRCLALYSLYRDNYSDGLKESEMGKVFEIGIPLYSLSDELIRSLLGEENYEQIITEKDFDRQISFVGQCMKKYSYNCFLVLIYVEGGQGKYVISDFQIRKNN